MDVSRWRRAFLTTFDRNHDRKCGKSLTLKASWIRNLFYQDSRWMENSTATFWFDCGKTSGVNVQTSSEKLLGPASWQGSGSRVARCAAVIGFYEDDSHTPPPLTHPTSPPVNFSYSRRWNWNSRGDVLTALKRSRQNRRTRWRRWREMTSRSAFYHGNPAGIAVSMPKGTT